MSKWSGTITIGTADQARLEAELLRCLNATEFASLQLEPGRIFPARGSGRRSVEVWNQNRTYQNADDACQNVEQVNQASYVFLYGDQPEQFRLAGGYQATVRQIGDSVAQLSSALMGGELPDLTDEIPLYSQEVVPAGRDYLDGGLDCNKVLRSVNGIAGPRLEIRSDLGVLIGNHRHLNRIVIDANGEGLNFCAPEQDQQIVECLPPQSEHCGELDGEVHECPGVPNSRAGFHNSYPYGGSPAEMPTVTSTQIPFSYTDQQLLGSCQYERQESGWVLTGSSLCPVCSCQEPAPNGYVGQTVQIAARPPVAEEPFHLQNPYLDQMTGWQFSGQQAVNRTAEELDLFEGLDYLEIQDGTLSQPVISLPAGRYRIQFRLAGTGDFTVKLINARNLLEILSTGETAGEPTTYLSEFFDVRVDLVRFEVQTAGTLSLTEVGIVRWQ